MGEHDDLAPIPEHVDIPPTEPAKPKRRRGRPPKVRKEANIGDDLAIDFEKYNKGGGKFHRFWCGLLPECPTIGATVGGYAFQHRGGVWVEKSSASRDDLFQPWDGAIVLADKERFDRLRDRVSRTVVRIKHLPPVKDWRGEEHLVPPRVEILSVPTDEQIEVRKKAGRPTLEYSHNPETDRAFADLAYFIHLPEGDPGNIKGIRTIRQTGLTWPGDD